MVLISKHLRDISLPITIFLSSFSTSWLLQRWSSTPLEYTGSIFSLYGSWYFFWGIHSHTHTHIRYGEIELKIYDNDMLDTILDQNKLLSISQTISLIPFIILISITFQVNWCFHPNLDFTDWTLLPSNLSARARPSNCSWKQNNNDNK